MTGQRQEGGTGMLWWTLVKAWAVINLVGTLMALAVGIVRDLRGDGDE